MKKFISGVSAVLFLFILSTAATVALAADATGQLNTTVITNFSTSLIGIINTVVVPVVFAIAFIVFIWGVFQAFILNGTNEEKRSEGTKFVFWAIIGFVIMLSIWGLVNIARSIIPSGSNARPDFPCFDQDPTKCNPSATNGGR